MKKFFLTALIVGIIFYVHAQNKPISEKIAAKAEPKKAPEFKNQAEQEDYWAKQIFEKSYKIEYFDVFKGKITLDDGYYQYGHEIVRFDNLDTIYVSIFKMGIFYPEIFWKNYDTYPGLGKNGAVKSFVDANNKHADSSKLNMTSFVSERRIDTLSIANFEEIKFLETSPRQKGFDFGCFQGE
jgi:hypothetical protein